MVIRCIMLVPEFENASVIDEIRARYDPLSAVIRPHITLVFPFESQLTAGELTAHMRTAMEGFAPFEIAMAGITASVEPHADYLFLNFTGGVQTVRALSERLYTGVLKRYQSEAYKERYLPHITVGKLEKGGAYKRALRNIDGMDTVFKTTIDSVCVKIIGENESSATTEMTVRL